MQSGGDHYFTPQPGSEFAPRELTVRLAGKDRRLLTSGGVFSSDRLDQGTRVLLDTSPPTPPDGELLDLGCGWGPLALTMALESPTARVWAVDVNERALELVRRNVERLGLDRVVAATPDAVPAGLRFRTIWSNPPIRVGKGELHELLLRWLPRLEPSGEAWLVVQRNLGADSLHRWLQDELGTERVHRAGVGKGYRVLRVSGS